MSVVRSRNVQHSYKMFNDVTPVIYTVKDATKGPYRFLANKDYISGDKLCIIDCSTRQIWVRSSVSKDVDAVIELEDKILDLIPPGCTDFLLASYAKDKPIALFNLNMGAPMSYFSSYLNWTLNTAERNDAVTVLALGNNDKLYLFTCREGISDAVYAEQLSNDLLDPGNKYTDACNGMVLDLICEQEHLYIGSHNIPSVILTPLRTEYKIKKQAVLRTLQNKEVRELRDGNQLVAMQKLADMTDNASTATKVPKGGFLLSDVLTVGVPDILEMSEIVVDMPHAVPQEIKAIMIEPGRRLRIVTRNTEYNKDEYEAIFGTSDFAVTIVV